MASSNLSKLFGTLSAALPTASVAPARIARPKPWAAQEAAIAMGVPPKEATLFAIAAFLRVKPEELTAELIQALAVTLPAVCRAHPQSYVNKQGKLVEGALPVYVKGRPGFAVKFLHGEAVAEPMEALSHACDMIAKSTVALGLYEEAMESLADLLPRA